MKYNLFCFGICFIFFAMLSLCSCSSTEPEEKLHILYDYSKNGFYSDFSESETESILKAFNIVIPENEKAAYIRSFGNEKDKQWETFSIEIGGIEDYQEFFTANYGRTGTNNLVGRSYNELSGKTSEDYYITFCELFNYNPNALTDEEKTMYSALLNVYDKINEARK